MRYSYGHIDRKRVLAYRPQLFQRTDDLLIFPGTDFLKWHRMVTELVDGLYQINAKNFDKGRHVDSSDLKLAGGLVLNINNEMKNLFDQDKKIDFSYQYVSTMNKEYKEPKRNQYGRYQYHIDRKVVEITPQLKYKHIMEIVNYAYRLWDEESRGFRREWVQKRTK